MDFISFYVRYSTLFIGRHSDFIVLADAGIEPRIVANLELIALMVWTKERAVTSPR
jgi:hypothetical protein